jgi:XTP/dITP diphosphohydrolase
MKPLLVATRNRGKQLEFRELLRATGRTILFPDDVGLVATPSEDALEIFETFEANAIAKAHWFARLSGLDTLADDSGVEVDALGGAPGVRSRRFAGADGPDHEVADANNAELMRRLAGIAPAARTARYRGVLVVSTHLPPGDEYRDVVAHGVTEGRILEIPRGAGGFGYDRYFWSEELQASFGEVTQAEKDTVSHRARAAAALAGALAI